MADEREPGHDLVAVVYDELRSLAHRQLARCSPGQTLQTTALVHEAYLRLEEHPEKGWEGRAHFFGAAMQAMRNVMVNEARRKASLRHGGAHQRVDGEPAIACPDDISRGDVLALDEALGALEAKNPEQAQIVMLRFFAGLSMTEIAQLLGAPLRNVEREWRFARTWLKLRIRGE